MLGLPGKERATTLVGELEESAAHVARAVQTVPADLVREADADGESWTTVKLLRRLAWHEPGELAVMRRVLSEMR